MKFIIRIFDKYTVNMKIHGKRPPSRGQNISPFQKKLRPELSRPSSVPIAKHLGISVDLSPVLCKLNVWKQDKILILDVGASKNEMVKTIQSKGFSKAVGIDIADEILLSAYGGRIDFRGLPLNERCRVIHFSDILDHFPAGSFDEEEMPGPRLLASKIYLRLLPKGYLIFRDVSDNVSKFKDCLLNIGFKQFLKHEKSVYIFQKE